MKQWEPHPLAEALPAAGPEEFEELVASIRQHGQIEPITLLDDLILDGRNRNAACRLLGVAVLAEPYTGTDPAAFVAAKNLHRRHLTAGQKAMAIAKLATLTKGNPHRELNAGIPAIKTVRDIAQMAGVNKETISDARTIHASGTEDEIASVADGTAAISTVAAEVRARRDGRRRRHRTNGATGGRIAVPAGKTLTELATEGIQLEESGRTSADASKDVGLGHLTYIVVRDAVLLSRRTDLNAKDAATVAEELRRIEETHQVKHARRKLRPITVRLWGPKGNRMKQPDKRRTAQFENAISFLVNTCETAVEMRIPHITDSQAEAAAKQLSVAEAMLRKLRERIREVQFNG